LINKSQDTNSVLEGNTLVHCNNDIYHIENNIDNQFNIRNIKKSLVLTNHSNYLPNLGYTKGKKGLSSYLRQKLVEMKLKKKHSQANNNNEIYDYLINNVLNIYSPNIDPRLQPYRDEKLVKNSFPNLEKDAVIIYTTGQILCNVTDKEFVYYYDKNNSAKVKYINKLPTSYVPKIRVIIKETEKNMEPQHIIPERKLKQIYDKFNFKSNFKTHKKYKHSHSKLTKKIKNNIFFLLYIMDNKNLFFGLGSILIIIIILNMIGVLGQPSKEVVVHKSSGYLPPAYYGPATRKNCSLCS